MISIHIDPAIYAMVGAAATISGNLNSVISKGVTRMTVSLIIIMFEITGSLKYVVPLMISIMVSKWTSDAMEKDSIYDMCIRLQEYPYLDHKKTQLINVSLLTVMETSIPVIQADKKYTFSDMERKLADLKFRFPSGDGGFPILKDDLFQGFISQTDLEHALYMHKQDSFWEPIPLIFNTCNRDHSNQKSLYSWMDQSPLMVTSICSMELVLELFIKLGIKTLMIVDHGKFIGLIHKKQLLGYLSS